MNEVRCEKCGGRPGETVIVRRDGTHSGDGCVCGFPALLEATGKIDMTPLPEPNPFERLMSMKSRAEGCAERREAEDRHRGTPWANASHYVAPRCSGCRARQGEPCVPLKMHEVIDAILGAFAVVVGSALGPKP